MASYNYKVTIQYDGTRYRGWQIQSNTDDTIQGKLETVLTRIVGYPVEVAGSGRTDAGVHALGQVANFHLKSKEESVYIMQQMNRYLPEDIAVINIEEVADRFHARLSAIDKTYRYRIHTADYSNVFERKFVYNYKGDELDIDKMKLAAKQMLGEHDFMSFCGNKHMKKSTVRIVNSITIDRTDSEIVIDYNGNGFLRGMVRIMTGTLIEVGNGTKQVEDIARIFEARNREEAGYTAPASGLCLVEVNY